MTDRHFHKKLKQKVEHDVALLALCGVKLTDPDVLDFTFEYIKAAVLEHYRRFTPALYRATLRQVFPVLKKKIA